MAVWFKRKISILTISIVSLAVAVGLALHVLFTKIEADQSIAIVSVIGSLLRDESAMSRSYLLAQSIEDMQSVGAIKCARLSRLDRESSAVFYDSTYKTNCNSSNLNSVNLEGIDGHKWKFEVVSNTKTTFYLLKWATIFGALLLLAFGYYLLSKMLAREGRRRESAEQRRRFLEDLTRQVGHDVASPISALRMIAARAPLDKETKAFFNDALSRTEGIFASLKGTDSSAEWIELRSEVSRIANEKMVTNEKFPRTEVRLSNVSLRLPRAEFGRVVSNLLDNAQDAGASLIEISEQRINGRLNLVLRDNGRPIPAEVQDRLGSRGNSLGKSGGSGLGLYHAFQFMKGIGGNLTLSCTGADKIILAFPEVPALGSTK